MILIKMVPDKDCVVVCDFVGILRDSNIKGKELVNLKKKTTKCRLVYRVGIELDDGSHEILQIATDTITCTQGRDVTVGYPISLLTPKTVPPCPSKDLRGPAPGHPGVL